MRIKERRPTISENGMRSSHSTRNERLREFLVATTSRAQRLRQSSPFFAVLNPDERDEVLQRLEGEL